MSNVQIIHGDCMTAMASMKDKEFDLAILSEQGLPRRECEICELEEEIEVWREKKAMLENDLAKAWKEIESLKCCGNCALWAELDCNNCKIWKSWKNPFAVCHAWRPDGLTKEEREKK